MKIKNRLSEQKGSALIQVLVSAGLVGFISLVFASMMSQQGKSLKTLEQKSEVLDLKNEILFSLRNPTICGCNLNPSKLAPTSTSALEFETATGFDLQGVRNDCLSSTAPFLQVDKRFSSGFRVASIKVEDFKNPTGGDTWQARLRVSIKDSNIALKDIVLPLSAKLSPAPEGKHTIEACSVSENLESPCSAIGGSLDQTTGECVDYVGQVARAGLILNSSGTRVQIYEGPSAATSRQISTCIPGTHSTPWGANIQCSGAFPSTTTSDVFLYRYNFAAHHGIDRHDAIFCNSEQGWKMSGCFIEVDGEDNDIAYLPNGCATNEFRQGSPTQLVITCVKNLWQ